MHQLFHQMEDKAYYPQICKCLKCFWQFGRWPSFIQWSFKNQNLIDFSTCFIFIVVALSDQIGRKRNLCEKLDPEISFKSEIFNQIAATLVTERFKTTQRLQGWKRTGTMLWCTTRNKNVKLGANVDLYLLSLCIYVLIFLALCLYSHLFVFVFKYFVHISSSVLLLCSHLFWVLLFQK